MAQRLVALCIYFKFLFAVSALINQVLYHGVREDREKFAPAFRADDPPILDRISTPPLYKISSHFASYPSSNFQPDT